MPIHPTVTLPLYVFNDERLREFVELMTDIQSECDAPGAPELNDPIRALLEEAERRGQPWQLSNARLD